MKRLIIVGAVLVAGCQSAESRKHEKLFADVRAGLETQLLDYPTARFRNVRVQKSGDSLCGEVNSKNRMGAYSGWTPFLNVGSEVIVLDGESVEANPCPGPQYEADFLPEDYSNRLQAR